MPRASSISVAVSPSSSSCTKTMTSAHARATMSKQSRSICTLSMRSLAGLSPSCKTATCSPNAASTACCPRQRLLCVASATRNQRDETAPCEPQMAHRFAKGSVVHQGSHTSETSSTPSLPTSSHTRQRRCISIRHDREATSGICSQSTSVSLVSFEKATRQLFVGTRPAVFPFSPCLRILIRCTGSQPRAAEDSFALFARLRPVLSLRFREGVLQELLKGSLQAADALCLSGFLVR